MPIASAAYIGEHSFADADKPVALGRPDAQDLAHARAFGQRVREKLDAAATGADLTPVQTPGARPYEGRTQLWDVDFIAVSEACTQCGLCVELCPVEAIDPRDSSVIDQVACITCCACIKACPQQARSKKPGPVMDAANRLDNLHKEPKTPECFL